MTDLSRLRPATKAECMDTLAFALRYDGRKRRDLAPDFTAHIAAERLLESLNRAGFVLMKKPPAPDHSAPPFHTPKPAGEG